MTTETQSYAAATDPQHASLQQDLYTSPPSSMTLVAALYLLENPLFTKTKYDKVFLIPRGYLENWILWAYHQPVPQEEMRRLQMGLRMAAEGYSLTIPKLNDAFNDPGPIDSSILSSKGNLLVLRDNVIVWDGADKPGKDNVYCSAVPERFYELLRSVHGVLCEDGKAISFQGDSGSILMQHHDPAVPTNGHLRPIEFQRYVYLEKVTQETEAEESGTEPISPMTKLMSDEARQQSPSLVPRVEIYPKKFTYAVVSESEKDSSPTEDRTGAFILISKGSDAVDSLNAILKKVMPQKSSSCVRLWANHIMKGCKATHMGDGYELVQIDMIEVENSKNKSDNRMTVEKWMERQGESNVIDLLVETRMNDSTQWARAALELENRIQVGDYVDAQDSAGKWYEAIVREVNEDSVTTHYSGWASKWNGKIRRRNGRDAVPGTARNAAAPAPLWTYTVRWRENIKIGQMVEVRDSTSPVHQPKWFRGYVRKIGKPNDKPRDLFGGARVEMLEKSQSTTPNGKGRPMLLLGRTQQILVEIPQEKQNTPALSSPTSEDDQEDDPPYLRWVNLYGEEICLAGTHMKIVSESKEKRPATINYEYDPRKPPVEVLKSHMHGAGFVRESLRGQPPAPGSVGLQNLGNSCFMNSIVQCLNHCEPLTLYFLREDYAKDLNRKNPLGSSGRVAMAYASLLSDIWGGQYSALAPRLLKTTIASFAPQFNNIYQHDSHEFCSFLMDGLHEDCNRVPSKPYVEDLEGFGIPDDKIAIESWRRHLLRHDSIIVDHCQGMHRSHVTCPICGRESIKFDVFSSISVPLTFSKDQSSVPLDDCLEKFTEGEQLDENNAWYCPSCQKHVCALKMLALWSVPDILIIHLKRFNYENRGGRVVRSKIEDRVVFPIDNLDMRPYILGPVDEAAPPIYNLFGVSEHTGATANSGHYTATVRNSIDNNWYRYNDSHVGTSSGEASVTGGAYLLFYKRIKGSCRWAGMEKVMMQRDIDPHGALDTDVDGFTEVKGKKKNKKRLG